jgi:Concanavalin A-like lectin/glucanases superfamily
MDTTQFNQSLNSSQKPGMVQQIIFGLTLVVVVYLTMIFIELIYKYINRLSLNKTELLPNTYNIEDKSINIPQNPNVQGSKPVHLSDNERSGIEFSYSFWLNVHPSAFRQELGLLHIFHKGYTSQFPLLAPGVYMRSDTNTLRVYMNTYRTWNNYVEVDNIPVGKWVHIVVVVKNDAMEVYVNGNLSRKLSFDGFIPYQNSEDICCFSQRRIALKHSIVPSTDETGFDVFGALKGQLSRLNYFSYALCYAEIQQIMNQGPSSKMDTATINTNLPPYLDDTWWTQGY